ncbi:MAG: long-chain-fatty-acid--CoA ligase [Actinomycetes bacterium]
MTFNLAVILRESAKSEPDRPVVFYEGRTMTYRELEEKSDRVAATLVGLGIGPGDPVGLQLPNVPEFPIALYGILKAGAVALPMNVLNKEPEVEFYLTDSRARAMITNADLGDEGVRGAQVADIDHTFCLGREGSDDLPAKARPFSELLDTDAGDRNPFVERQPDDPAILLYTSGTTGRPKGVMLTHFQLFMNARAHVQAFEMDSGSVVIAVMPLFHALGLSGILDATVYAGGAVVLIKRFDADKVLDAIQKHNATVLHAVPTIYHTLLNHPTLKDYDTASLRTCGSAGAPIAAELLDSFEKEFGVDILEMYGLTESGPLATYNPPGDRKHYSIGKPIWGTEVQVWDDEGNELPRGKEHVGEIVIRGHNTMRGYLNNEQATEEAFAGGWLHTGDLGYCDEDGFFFIVDRKKEMIIRGGYNVYPREVEEVLYTHPAVNEVAVVGVPDERLGEEVKAFVSLKPGRTATERELVDYAKERVAAYKYPRSVEIIPDLPKGPTGKILKKELAS